MEPTEILPKAKLEDERLAAAAVPVPERLTDWGLPVALSATLRVALRVPVAEALKVTLIVQFEPAATLDPQVLVWVKSPALVPETETLVTLKDALPLLVKVTD